MKVQRKEGHRPLAVGYHRASEALNRLFVIVFSSVLLLCALPIMLLTALTILILDGRPLFYSGVRLGRNKVPFSMYKFRTLVSDAQQRIGAELFTASLSSNRQLLTKSGKFLRDTRLDEIPQLFNVLRGDMDVLGPRPERPEIYEKFCKQIKGYDRRFSVKPGLIGYSQIFTPHNAPKRMRYLVDNKFLAIRHRYSIELLLVLAAMLLLFLRFLYKLFLATRSALGNLTRRRSEKRILVRHQPKGAVVRLARAGAGQVEGVLKDINEEALLVFCPAIAGTGELQLQIVATITNWHGVKVRKTAFGTGEVMSAERSGDERYPHRYVVRYQPATPRNGYIIHQYLLDSSILSARRGRN